MSTAPPPAPPAEPKKSRKGCILAIVIVLVLLLAACLGGCWWAAKKGPGLMVMGMEAMRPQLESALDPSVPPDLRAEFLAEFDAQLEWTREVADAGFSDPRLQSVGTTMQVLGELMNDQVITADEAERFIDTARSSRGEP